MKHAFGLNDEDARYHFINLFPIIHVYGQIGLPRFLSDSGRGYEPTLLVESVLLAASELYTIHDKNRPQGHLRRVSEWIRTSERICFLGFGYHASNLAQLGFSS